jgi:flagellar biosynthetic protein FlhB
MADEADSGERTEDATQQRREDFRKRGQVAQTRELSSVLLLFSAMLLVWLTSRFFLNQFHELFDRSFGDNLVETVRHGQMVPFLWFAVSKTALLIVPILMVIFVIGFASSILQVGFIYNEEALQIRWDRIDPVQGFKRMLSLKSVVEGGKSLVKLTLILFIAYTLLARQIQILPTLIYFSVPQILSFLGELMIRILGGVGTFIGTLAAIDYFYQRWELEKEMRMTKQEVKEEIKSREGDPMIRARIKRIQRDLASRRMMDDVPKADVIVTNPTHIAVALKYDDNMVAPRVIAKGADLIAEKIKELARQHNVPIVENKPLARTIFKTLKIGQMIPRELYTAVAEVLSYVFRLRRRAVR